MMLYHGSAFIVDKPFASYSNKYLDFGVGFYVTSDNIQAENWAKRKAVRLNASPIVSVYTMSNDLTAYKGLVFDKEDYAWLDFVAKCRNGDEDYKNYDFISGSVANDDVFVTVDLYMRGIWDRERALSEIRYFKTSHQICLTSQTLIDTALKFDTSYKVAR